MAKTEVTGNRKVYLVCERLFNRLYKSCEVFKSIIEDKGYATLFNKDGVFYLGSTEVKEDIPALFDKLGVEGFDNNKIINITLTDIFKYDKEFGNLYAGGVRLFIDTESGTEVVSLDSVISNNDFLSKEEVLVKKGRKPDWGKTEKLKPSIARVIKGLDICKDYSIAKIFMREDDLVLGFYSKTLPYKEFKYGDKEELDVIFEKLIKILDKFKFKVENVYWFIQDSYSNIRVRKTSEEYSLFIS